MNKDTMLGCPSCGGGGSIPDGVYTSTGARLFDPAQLNLVMQGLNELHEMAKAGATQQQLDRVVDEDHPELAPIKSLWRPKTTTELYAAVGTTCSLALLIFTAVSLSSGEDDEPTPPIHALEEHIRALDLACSMSESTQQYSRGDITESENTKTVPPAVPTIEI